MVYAGAAYTPPVGTIFRFTVSPDPWSDPLIDKTSGFTVVSTTHLRFEIATFDTVDLNPQFPLFYELFATETGPITKSVSRGVLNVSPADDAAPVSTNPYASPSPLSPAVFEVKWGDTLYLGLSLRSNGLPVDLTGGKLFFTLKTNKSDADVSALLSKESPGGVSIVDAKAGDVEVVLTAAETEALAKDVPLYWDVQFKDTSGIINTVREGIFVFTQDVTRRTV